jgi:hypothetical protein
MPVHIPKRQSRLKAEIELIKWRSCEAERIAEAERMGDVHR